MSIFNLSATCVRSNNSDFKGWYVPFAGKEFYIRPDIKKDAAQLILHSKFEAAPKMVINRVNEFVSHIWVRDENNELNCETYDRKFYWYKKIELGAEHTCEMITAIRSNPFPFSEEELELTF